VHLEPPADFSGPYAFRGEPAHRLRLRPCCRRPPPVFALGLGLGDALALALEKKVPGIRAGAIARDTGTAPNIAVGRRAVIMSLRRPPAVGPKGEARGFLGFG
jgi:hypothetical protein